MDDIGSYFGFIGQRQMGIEAIDEHSWHIWQQ